MQLKFAMLADWAGETREGKLVISGEFDTIFAPQVPAVHPSMYFVARLHANITEGSDHTLVLSLISPAQETIVQTDEIPFAFLPSGPGRPLKGQVIVHVSPLELPAIGKYHFELRVDNRLMETVPLELRLSGQE
jgi:hypothetical protein